MIMILVGKSFSEPHYIQRVTIEDTSTTYMDINIWI